MEFTVNLDMKGLDRLSSVCDKLSKRIKVGIFGEESKIASLQHFGGEGVYTYGPFKGEKVDIPPRPFLSIAMEHYGKDIINSEKDRLLSDTDTAINRIGGKAVTAVQMEIDNIAAAGGNSERTIETKGKDSPLIDTGKMRASVTYEVENG